MSENYLARLASVLCLTLLFTTPAFASAPASGPSLWLRADAGVSKSSTGKVSAWADQSGFGINATMSTASRRPRFISGALNGLPVIRFDGAQSLYLSSPVSPTAFTVFAVGKNRKTNETFSMILGPGGNSPNNQMRWQNGNQALFVGTSNSLPATTSTIGNTRIYHALSARYNGSVMRIYRNGNQTSSRSITTSGPWTLSNVGAYYSSYFMTGDLAEVLIYSRALSNAERAQTNSYLSAKYALPCSSCSPAPVCQNGLCESGESCSTCSYDCGPCFICNNNGICEYNEGSSCSDCCPVLPLQTDEAAKLPKPCLN